MGAKAVFGPTQLFLNRGFSTLVWINAERRIGSIDWRGGWHTVRDAISNPEDAIERAGGLFRWIQRETFPGSDPWSWAFAPNLLGHTVAGGISYLHLAELFEYQGVPAARPLAAVISMGAIFTNEVIEAAYNHPYSPGPATSLADLFFFDPLGIVLFEVNEDLGRFFADKLQVADWSPQAAVTLPDGRVQNTAQVMSYWIPLPFSERLRALVLIGQGSQLGAIYNRDDGYSFGVTMGFAAKWRELVDRSGDGERIIAEFSAGFYVARKNSLLGSLIFANRTTTVWQLNAYPGLFPGPLRDLGVWATVGLERESSFGISYGMPLGFAFGYDVARR